MTSINEAIFPFFVQISLGCFESPRFAEAWGSLSFASNKSLHWLHCLPLWKKDTVQIITIIRNYTDMIFRFLRFPKAFCYDFEGLSWFNMVSACLRTFRSFRSFRPKIRYSCCSIYPSGMQVRNPSRLPKQEQKMLGQGFLGTWREPMMITDAFLPLFVSIGQGGIQWPRPYRDWWLRLDQPPEHKHPPGRWSKPSPRAQWLEPRWSGQQTCHRCWWRRGGKIWRPSLRPVQESTVPTAPHRVPKLSLSWSLFGSLVVLASPLTLSELGGK